MFRLKGNNFFYLKKDTFKKGKINFPKNHNEGYESLLFTLN